MLVVLSTAPMEAAETLASSLITERLAACVNVLPGITSVYRWKGEVQRDSEALLIIKTARDRVAALRTRLAELHPYDVPEIVAFDVVDSHAPYHQWVVSESTPDTSG